MIISIKHKGLKALHEKGETRGVRQDHVERLRELLQRLEEASQPDDMNLPSFRLHPLKGAMKGHWSAKVNGNWRITWRFKGRDVELVDYQDYH